MSDLRLACPMCSHPIDCSELLGHADRTLDEIRRQYAEELAAVKADRDRLQAVQLLGMSRVNEATREWQDAHKTPDLPDLGTLIAWLRDERDARVPLADVVSLVLDEVYGWKTRGEVISDMRRAAQYCYARSVRDLAARVAAEMSGETR